MRDFAQRELFGPLGMERVGLEFDAMGTLMGAWGMSDAPRDAFMARGYLGQYIFVVPSADLVIVRMGQSHGLEAEIAGVGEVVRETIATLCAHQ